MFTTVFTVAPHMLEFNGPDQNLPFALLPQPSSPPPPTGSPRMSIASRRPQDSSRNVFHNLGSSEGFGNSLNSQCAFGHKHLACQLPSMSIKGINQPALLARQRWAGPLQTSEMLHGAPWGCRFGASASFSSLGPPACRSCSDSLPGWGYICICQGPD